MTRPPAASQALVRQIQAQAEVIRRRPAHNPRALAVGADGRRRVAWLSGGD